jgi:hypothetical protein
VQNILVITSWLAVASAVLFTTFCTFPRELWIHRVILTSDRQQPATTIRPFRALHHLREAKPEINTFRHGPTSEHSYMVQTAEHPRRPADRQQAVPESVVFRRVSCATSSWAPAAHFPLAPSWLANRV